MDYYNISTTNDNNSTGSSSVKGKKKGNKSSGGKGVKLSTDPQSVAARERRHRISDRFKILQSLVPGGTKMDTVSMLDEAIHYVKFLKTQIWIHQHLMNYNSNTNNNSFVVDDDHHDPSSSSVFLPNYCYQEGGCYSADSNLSAPVSAVEQPSLPPLGFDQDFIYFQGEETMYSDAHNMRY